MMPAIRVWSLRTLLIAAIVACGGGGGGVTPPPPPGPGPQPGPPSGSASVTLGASSFSPTTVSITRTGTVTWNNTSGVTHNVTFAPATGAPSDIGNHSSGSNTRTFNTAGSFSYSCTLHAGMSGSVSVQ